jgi:hypothetical protein
VPKRPAPPIGMSSVLRSVVVALWCGAAFAAPPAAPVQAEIRALLSKLQVSGCQFNRNGTWFSGAEAEAHLLRKLKYIEARSAVQSTERFVELAASKSSSSGKPYLVKCGSGTPIESRQWLTDQLASIRGTAGGSKL